LRLAGRLTEAVRVLRRGLQVESDDYRLHEELGTALCEIGRYEEAIGSFLAVSRLKPDCDEIENKIGYAFASRGLFHPATIWFQRGWEKNPKCTKYLGFYGRALIETGCIKLAADVFEQWIKTEPDNPVVRHMSCALLGRDEITKAPADYIRTLFNDCAARFDATLFKLKYCGPQLVVDVLQQVAAVPAQRWEILDAGCGTGLAGTALRPLARRLVGVDLSVGMLDQARQRNEYDELIEADMHDFLRSQPRSFDVVTASDVLSYIGELSEYFQSVSQSLRPGGLTVVAVEALNGDRDYQLNPTGRFSHSLPYLRSVMDSSGLVVAHVREDVLRCESGNPVPGLVVAGVNAAS
jgi:predicted TPR repeat methyltransferase